MARILINALQATNQSGTGRYVTQLLEALARLEPEHEVYAAMGGEVMPASAFCTTGMLHTPWRNLWREHCRIPLQGRRFDLVHYPSGMGPLFPCPRLLVTVHDLIALRRPEWFLPGHARYYRWAATRGVRRAVRIVADSQHTARDLEELLAVPADRVDVVPLGVSARFSPRTRDEQAQARRALGLPERFLLFVGTHEPRKNLGRLVRAWESVSGEIEEDLVLAGRRGWRCEGLLDQCARSPHAARIHLPGHVAEEQLPALLSSATAFVWPSLYEGFGLPPLEAMACGTPVITADSSSLPEVMGDAALLVAPRDIEALAEALRRVCLQAALHEALREQGLARAAQFTWENTARLTLDSYARALESLP